MHHRVRVWDLPTRLFHWSLAISIIALVVTAKLGGNAMVWHIRLGHLVLALLLFRVIWGLAGGRWSRFSSFLHHPRELWATLRGHHRPELSIGHSPTGAASVFALLAVLGLQVASGLASDDEIAFSGPLTRFVSGDLVSQATSYHKDVGQWLVLGLVLLHVAAVLFYVWVKRQNLVRPMLHGDKVFAVAVEPSRDDLVTRLGALVVAGVCVAFAYWVSGLGN
jgi:cytochrome b